MQDVVALRAAVVLTAGMAIVALSPAHAQMLAPIPETRTTFGNIGLIEMPSARMAPDGELSVGASFMTGTQRYNSALEVTPWLEVSFRYSHIAPYLGYSFLYDRSYGVKIRLVNEGEYRPAVAAGADDIVGTGVYGGEYLVASKHVFDDFDVSLGMGWGRLGSVGTFSNPLGHLSQSFYVRAPSSGAGQFQLNQLFHGPKVGLFGGVVWRTPIDNLTLLAEYSSDRYSAEDQSGAFHPHMQLNFGADYRVLDWMQLGLYWLYGSSVGVNATFDMDPTRDEFPFHVGPDRVEPHIRTADQQIAALQRMSTFANRTARQVLTSEGGRARRRSDGISSFAANAMSSVSGIEDVRFIGTQLEVAVDKGGVSQSACERIAGLAGRTLRDVHSVQIAYNGKGAITCAVPEVVIEPVALTFPPKAPGRGDHIDRVAVDNAIRRDGAEQKIAVLASSVQGPEAIVYYQNDRYEFDAEAAGRLVRVLMRDEPPDIEIFRMISVKYGLPIQEYQVSRSDIERIVYANPSFSDTMQAISVSRPSMNSSVLDAGVTRQYPQIGWSLFPQLHESLFDPDKPLRFGLSAGVAAAVTVARGLIFETQLEANIWNNIASTRRSNSQLPHVRSDYPLYYHDGANGIADLFGSYRFRITPDIFGLVKAGYLESQFGGFGGEFLWRPERSRIALGVDLYQVWQRNFDRLFGFRNYNVLTGHASVYYQSPWWQLDFQVSAGRYLAGDRGVTIQVMRQFSTGVQIGAFATFTNVPAKLFGEGSFDKGIVVSIPLEWALPVSSQGLVGLTLRPLTRDGGQRLDGDTTLYYQTDSSSYRNLIDHWQSLIR